MPDPRASGSLLSPASRPMRLWTVHPSYLDPQGLVALWREGLLAQKVLLGGTRGYRQHPQLIRFREHADPVRSISAYLHAVVAEASRRGYSFDASKLPANEPCECIEVASGQLLFEWGHLRSKLERRSPQHAFAHRTVAVPDAHPLFRIVDGPVASWERP